MIYALYQYITNMPSWQLLTGFFIGYLGYYLMQVVKVSNYYPRLYANEYFNPFLTELSPLCII